MFTFTFTGSGVSGSGSLTGTAIGSGVYNITTGTGTFNDGSGSVTITLIANPNAPGTTNSSIFTYDDLVTPGALTGLILDNSGLLFAESNGAELNLWGDGLANGGNGIAGSSLDTWYEDSGPNGNGTFAISTVPEPSMALLLIPALGFVGLIRRKFMV